MREECRVQVADLIEESRADINVDPLLTEACAVDLKKYCSDVPQGAGRRELKLKSNCLYNHTHADEKSLIFFSSDIMCLQNVVDSKKPLQPDCYKMFTTRVEMFRNAAKVSPSTEPAFVTFVFQQNIYRFIFNFSS